MSTKDTGAPAAGQEQQAPGGIPPEAEQQIPPEAEAQVPDPETEALKEKLVLLNDQYQRLDAEYSNYRSRTSREKEQLGSMVRSDTAAEFLPVYDNLERALKVETADADFRKGVETTMDLLKEVFAGLGITEIPALGQPFDPLLHNAVMHVDDESLGENTVADVFQTGFKCGDRVVRCAMVKVAN